MSHSTLTARGGTDTQRYATAYKQAGKDTHLQRSFILLKIENVKAAVVCSENKGEKDGINPHSRSLNATHAEPRVFRVYKQWMSSTAVAVINELSPQSLL